MAINYLVSYSLSATGPWTAVNTVSVTTDIVTNLTAGTSYFFQIITQDTVTGLVGAPVVAGPFLTAGTGVSPSNTTIPPATQLIDTNLNKWTLVAGQIALNGVIDGSTTGVVLLLWFNNLIYQHVVDTAFPNGNWWSSPAMPANSVGGVVWNDIGATDPRPPIGITIATIATEINNTPFTVTGTVTGYSSAPVLNYQNTINGVAGPFQALPVGAVLPTSGTSTFSFTNPAILVNNANNTVTVRDTGLISTVASNVFSIIAPPTITSVALSSNTFSTTAPVGTTIGTLTANMSNGVFSGNFSLPAGVANDANFNVVGNALSVGVPGMTAGNYSINVTATQSGVSNSPFTQVNMPLVASVVTSLPNPTNPSILINLTGLGQPLPGTIWGTATSALIDTNNDASNGGFFHAANTNFINLAKQLDFKLLRFNALASNSKNGVWEQFIFGNNPATPDFTYMNNWFNNSSRFFNNSNRLICGMGPSSAYTNNTGSFWVTAFTQMANHFKAQGQECFWWEYGNEPNGNVDQTTYMNSFNQVADALHAINPNYKLGGPCLAGSADGSWMSQFSSVCGAKAGFCTWHVYPLGGAGSDNGTAYNAAIGGSDSAGVRRQLAGAAGANLPLFLGEYSTSFNCNDGMMQQIGGAIFNALILQGAYDSDSNFTMGGNWETCDDGQCGMIQGSATTAPQGWYLGEAGTRMGGTRVSTPTTPAGNFKITASVNARNYAVQIINYNTGGANSTFSIGFQNGAATSANLWTISPTATSGSRQTNLTATTGIVSPPNSVVILYGTF